MGATDGSLGWSDEEVSPMSKILLGRIISTAGAELLKLQSHAGLGGLFMMLHIRCKQSHDMDGKVKILWAALVTVITYRQRLNDLQRKI